MSFLEQIETYQNFDFSSYFGSVTPEDVRTSLSRPRLAPDDLLNLLSPAAEPFLEDMALRARQITRQYFGRTIGLYAPLYISDYCSNHCTYCGFNSAHHFHRTKLTLEEIEQEARAIAQTGIRHVLVLTGEAPSKTPLGYLEGAVRLLKHHFASIGLEIFPMDEESYRVPARVQGLGGSGLRVGIAGIGGIGSNVARLLAQSGLSRIRVADFDRVERSNLNRQFYTLSQVGKRKTESLKKNLLAISPDMDIQMVDRLVGPGQAREVFSDCSILVEGFDCKESKKNLVEEWASTGKPLVGASGIAGRNLDKVGIKQMGNCHIVGDFISDQDRCELFPPKIALVASLMASIILNLMKGNQDEFTEWADRGQAGFPGRNLRHSGGEIFPGTDQRGNCPADGGSGN